MSESFPTPCIRDITSFLFIGERIESLRKSDLIIVLGNDFIEGTAKQIGILYEKKIITDDSVIILSGATGTLNKSSRNECDDLFDIITNKYGLPESLFIKENQAKNAYQNFEYSKKIIEGMGGFKKFSSILCVGYAFVLRRASMYAIKLQYPLEIMQFYGTVDNEGRNIGFDTWWKSEVAIERVMAELERIGKYGRSGDLAIM